VKNAGAVLKVRLQARHSTPRYPVGKKETVEGVAMGLTLALIRKTKHISDSIRRRCPPSMSED
jgi:hypothetical protein